MCDCLTGNYHGSITNFIERRKNQNIKEVETRAKDILKANAKPKAKATPKRKANVALVLASVALAPKPKANATATPLDNYSKFKVVVDGKNSCLQVDSTRKPI